jgi:hypothetical protein
MKSTFRTFAVLALLVAPAATTHAQVSFGIRIGEPPPPRAYRVPPQPGPDYFAGRWEGGRRYVNHSHRWDRDDRRDDRGDRGDDHRR